MTFHKALNLIFLLNFSYIKHMDDVFNFLAVKNIIKKSWNIDLWKNLETLIENGRRKLVEWKSKNPPNINQNLKRNLIIQKK